MAKKIIHAEVLSSDFLSDISSSSDKQQDRSSNVTATKSSIKNYVTNVLSRLGRDDIQRIDLSQTEIKIDTKTVSNGRTYENVSAFRQYHSHAEGTTRTDAYRRQEDLGSDDDLDDHTLLDHTTNSNEQNPAFNLDPDPIIQERESGEQLYKQKVYLRQLQPPTPQPVEIQIQEVLLEPQAQKPPIHVRVGQREPRTPSPIIIKSTPPQPPQIDPDQPIIYNKYVPPPKQPPQQIIIHRYPDLPPKPRPIVVEQWLPFKPAPKRIIKQSLPPEALQTPRPPHNIIVSYGKPRTLVEVELVRLPMVKIDPYTYQQMSTGGGQQQLGPYQRFQHERDYLSGDTLAHASHPSNQFKWRI